MGIRSSAGRPHSVLGKPLAERLRVANYLGGVLLVLRRCSLTQGNSLGGDPVHKRSTLHHREHGLVHGLRVLGLAQHHAATRAAQNLVRSERDDIGVRNRTRDRLAGDQPDEVGCVHHQDRSDLVRDGAERGKVDESGVGGRPADDHRGPVLEGQFPDLVVVDHLGVLAHPVGDDVEPLAGEVNRRTVREVPTVRQAHRQDGVPGHGERPVGGDVGAGTAMRLQVGVLGTE